MMGPLKLDPVFKERIWGGDRFGRLYNKKIPSHVAIGESWEVADLPEGVCTVANGPWAGNPLNHILDQYGLAMGFTKEQIQHPFGLLVKLLDANDILSVQVHPDQRACQMFPGSRLKTECWYVMAAEPGAIIYKGLKPGVTKEQFRQAIIKGGLEDLMQVYPVKKGDFHFLPAGTVHALGAGAVIAEVQTPSDTTYRVYDWNRVDSTGKSRQLHVEEALASIHFDPPPPPESHSDNIGIGQSLLAMGQNVGTSKLLAACPYFHVVHTVASTSTTRSFSNTLPYVMIVLSGQGAMGISEDRHTNVDYHAGDTFLIPKLDTLRITIDQPSEYLLTCLGSQKA